MASDLDGIIRFNEAVDKVLAESVVRYATDKEAIARQLETDRRDATLLSDTIIDSTPDDFFMIDAQFRLVRWNQFFRKQTGLTDEELKGKPILTLIAEEDRPMAEAKFMTAVAMGYISTEVRVQTIHGVRLYFKTARRLDVNGTNIRRKPLRPKSPIEADSSRSPIRNWHAVAGMVGHFRSGFSMSITSRP